MYYSVDYDVETQREWGGGVWEAGDGNIEWSDLAFKWMERLEGEDQWTKKGETFFTTTYSSMTITGSSNFYTFNVTTPGYQAFYTLYNEDAVGLQLPGQWSLPRRGTFVQPLREIPAGVHELRLECQVLPHESDDEGGSYPNDFKSVAGVGFGDTSCKFKYGANAIVKIKNFNIFEALLDTD